MSQPGYLKPSELSAIDKGAKLAVKPARAYRRAMTALRKRYPEAAVYGEFGGYRWADLQNAMAAASRTAQGSSARAKYKLSSTSTVPVAYHPDGSHEDGLCFDLGGAPINDWVLSTLRTYGFTRQFGSRDPNHFQHDGKTAAGIIPSSKVYYVVQAKDVLSTIAPKYKTTWQAIAKLNKLSSPYTIHVGQRIRVR